MASTNGRSSTRRRSSPIASPFFARCIKDCPVAPNQTILREERIALRHKIGKLDTEVA
jgi:hypothetical protein